jgi:hypothetical protein
MAILLWCLCLLLTLWMVSLRPSATVRTGIASFSLWLGTKEAKALDRPFSRTRTRGISHPPGECVSGVIGLAVQRYVIRGLVAGYRVLYQVTGGVR